MIHILVHIDRLDNYMFCGKKNTSYEGETWFSPYEIAMNIHSIEEVTCEACRELYSLKMLADA